MANVRSTQKDQSTHEPDKRPEGEPHQLSEWLAILCLLLLIVGVFSLVAWLASMAPESAVDSDLQNWLMP
jgi:hypothetical protein